MKSGKLQSTHRRVQHLTECKKIVFLFVLIDRLESANMRGGGRGEGVFDSNRFDDSDSCTERHGIPMEFILGISIWKIVFNVELFTPFYHLHQPNQPLFTSS